MTVRIDPLRNPSGFALVGVVMFVLVLTILGLSLFSLTSFESQFLNISVSRSESFYAASDGIERARFTLVASGRLETVRSQVPDGTIVWASARQGTQGSFTAVPDSDGLVDWTGVKGDVWIRTLAIQRGQRTLLEARFKPHEPVNYYRRLMTLSGGLTVIPVYPVLGVPTARIIALTGEIWRNTPGVLPLAASEHNPTGGVAAPEIGSYFARYWNTAVPVAEDHPSPQHDRYTLPVSGSLGYKFFKTAANGAWYSVQQTPTANDVNINVSGSGTAIWLLDRGMRSDILVNVSGPVGSSLVIVAGQTTQPGADNLDRGFNLLGSITSTIPIVFVTDGVVDIEHKSNTSLQPALLPLVSIYARDVQLMGPGAPGFLTMIYPPSGTLNVLVDALYALGILPNTDAGVASRLDRLAGTWRDITDSTPI